MLCILCKVSLLLNCTAFSPAISLPASAYGTMSCRCLRLRRSASAPRPAFRSSQAPRTHVTPPAAPRHLQLPPNASSRSLPCSRRVLNYRYRGALSPWPRASQAPTQLHLSHGHASDRQMGFSWLTRASTPTLVLLDTKLSFSSPQVKRLPRPLCKPELAQNTYHPSIDSSTGWHRRRR